MERECLKKLLEILKKALNNNAFDEDKQKIQYLDSELKKTEKELPTLEKLEELKKIEIDLEIKYEQFYEIGNYFDPIYVKIKREIHNKKVKKIREENRRKGNLK